MEAKKRNVDSAWATFFYEQNIPFAVAQSASFKEAIKETANLRRPYLPPSYHNLRKRLLDEKRKELSIKVKARMASFIHSFGCTISVDGWSSVTNRPLMNIMQVCHVGEEFLASVDTSGHFKDHGYMVGIMRKYVELVGPTNVVEICTDNASVMKKAVKKVQETYPHIYFQGCGAHILNLIIGDWGKQAWMKKVVDEAKTMVDFKKKRHIALAVFRSHEKDLSLIRPGATRFATNYLMIDRLLKVRKALELTVVDPKWDDYVRTLGSERKYNHRLKARNTKKTVQCDIFWGACENYHELVAPAVLALREFDGKSPCMAKVHVIMTNLEKHIKSLRNEPVCLPPSIANNVEERLQKLWSQLRTELHFEGALLNPYLINDRVLHDDCDARTALQSVFEKYAASNTEVLGGLLQEFHAYQHKVAPYDVGWNVDNLKVTPHVWWDQLGYRGKHLPRLARRLLAQVVSSSSCEQNWSHYSFVHNKVKNRLHASRVEDLVYVYSNSKLNGRGSKPRTM